MRGILPAVVLSVLPLCGWANESGFLREGIEGCYATVGEGGEATHGLLSDSYGWEGDTDPEMGLGFLYPPTESEVFVTVALDGSFCQVESASIGSATASEVLRDELDRFGDEPDYDKDEMGCTRLDLGDGYAVTITSGGDDPTCGSDENSALRFTYE